jgi:hypothetical protein
MIAKWIDEGAKFDGPDSNVALLKLVPAAVAKQSEEPKPTLAMPTGKETIHFTKDISTVLAANCLSCHERGRPGGQLSMDTFREMLRGGKSGSPWKPGDPADSLIIKKLKGTAGARMPLKKPPLADDVIAKFEKWIAEGATFDGASATESIQAMAAVARAKSATHEELSALRRESAERTWRLADPANKPVTRETKNFFIVGNVNEAAMDEAAEAAEAQAVAVAKLMRVPADQPLVKGRITLFLFPARYDYSEFGRMVEQRQLPADWRGHAKFDVAEAYGAVVMPSADSEYSLGGIIGQQVAAVYAASLTGGSPAWFSDGCGKVFAARIDGRSARVQQWNQRLKELFAGKGIEGFIDHKLSPQDNDVAAYGFMKDVMASSVKFESLLVAMRGGEAFDPAFTRIFGPPQKVVGIWAKSAKAL